MGVCLDNLPAGGIIGAWVQPISRGLPSSDLVHGMSDIFISYASGDRERAKVLAETLVRRGWSVWWDRTIPPGQEYDKVIENALDSAKCVAVLWSTASAASSWVKTEAAEAMRRKILVPALLDQVTIPLEFRRLQAADLSHWRGDPSHPELEKFFDSIAATIHEPAAAAATAAAAPPPGRWKRAAWPAIAVIGALAGVALGLMLSRSQPADTPGRSDWPRAGCATAQSAAIPPPPPPPAQPEPSDAELVTAPTVRTRARGPVATAPTSGLRWRRDPRTS